MIRNHGRELPVLYLVIPVYNEEEIIEQTAAICAEKIDRLAACGIINESSRILFVNDGSSDNSCVLLTEIVHRGDRFVLVSLSGNCGHQNAILAGMMMAKKADIVITMDADLQQDIEALDDFIRAYKNGSEVVYGVRRDRNTDKPLKKLSALGYYRLMHAMGIKTITNHSDYRLVSRKVLDTLAMYGENNLFLRGLIPSMGFPSDIVYYDVKERAGGSSKYTFSKMLRLASDGITSFTVRPLQIIGGFGLITVLTSVVISIVCLVEWIQDKNVKGYTTLLLVTLFLSGIILLSLGVIGEYIGKIYMETKNRPRYIIDSVICRDSEDDN